MSALLVLSGLALIALPGVRRLPSNQLVPAEWARAAAAALRLGHATVRLGLLLGALPTVLRAVRVDEAASTCHKLFGPIAPGGPIAGWASAACLMWLVISRRRALSQHHQFLDRLRVEPWLGRHEEIDGVDVVTLSTDAPLAYAVPGSIGQVVLSDSLRNSLADDELAAVLKHERSHLRHRHDRLLAVAGTVDASFGAWPFARSSTHGLRLAIERWADEDAAPSLGERRAVRAALLKTTATLLGPALAFTSTCTILDRLAALEAEPPAPARKTRVAALAPIGAMAMLTGALIVAWTTYTHHGWLGVVGFCPM